MGLAVHGGYLQVETATAAEDASTGPREAGGRDPGTHVTLLAGVAELAERIDVARAEAARTAGGGAGGRAAAPPAHAPAAADRTGDAAAEGGTGPEDVELAQAEAALAPRRAAPRGGGGVDRLSAGRPSSESGEILVRAQANWDELR